MFNVKWLRLSASALVALMVLATAAGCAPGVRGPSATAPQGPAPAAAPVEGQATEVREVVVVESAAPEVREVVVVESNDGSTQRAEEQAAEVRALEHEIAELRDQIEVNRARADSSAERADAASRQSQQAIRALQTELAEVRTRAETAATQSEQALQLAKEHLSNLITLREEQRAMVERNVQHFDAMEQRLAALEKHVAETDQQRQARITANSDKSTQLGQQLVESDQALAQLREQLSQLQLQHEQVRAQLDSGPMLRMLRELEDARRDTAALRGALEGVQREQDEDRKRLQNYYLDLDTRIQALQDQERARREAEEQSRLESLSDGLTGEAVPAAGDDAISDAVAPVLDEMSDVDMETAPGSLPNVIDTVDTVPGEPGLSENVPGN